MQVSHYLMFYKMKKLIFLFVAISVLGGCKVQSQEGLVQESPSEVAIGLGYGFIDKAVEIYINDSLILSMVGTQEIEDHAQLLGPKIVRTVIVEGNIIDVQVGVDGILSEIYTFSLENGLIIEINNHPVHGLSVRNTKNIIQE